jgi:hypothetical protein
MTVKTLDIDTTLPADDVQPDKSEMRAKWSEIKTKYETLAGQALRYRGAWSSGAYLSGDVVTHVNGWWRASADITAEVPGTDAEWVAIGYAEAATLPSVPATTGITSATTVELALTSLQTDLTAAEDAITVLQGTVGTEATVANSIVTPSVDGSNQIAITSAQFALYAQAGEVKDVMVRVLNSTDPANATTVILPKDGTVAEAKVVFFIDATQTGAVTFTTTDSAGTVDGATSIVVPGGSARYILVTCITNAGGTSAAYRTNALSTDAIVFVIDGAGSTITTGIKGDLRIPFPCIITGASLLADQSGSIVVDVWKDTLANFPPTDADSITASAPPTITTDTDSDDTTLTGWTTAIAAGDVLRFNVDSVTSIQRVTLTLQVVR